MKPAEGFIDGTFWRKARKAHRCHGYGRAPLLIPDSRSRRERLHDPGCRRTIERGESYLEYLGESAACEAGQRYTLPCAGRALREVTP